MEIDPKVGMWLSIALAGIAFLTGAGTQLTTLFGETTANHILAIMTLLLGVGNAANAVLHAIPSKPNATFPLGPTK